MPGQRIPNEPVHGLRLLRDGGLAGADCPHRLVCDQPCAEALYARTTQDRLQLGGDNPLGLVLEALLQGLADAQDRNQPRREGRGELFRHCFVALAV
ncbi:hypothetical protein D9M72_595840 [compost metagenome]